MIWKRHSTPGTQHTETIPRSGHHRAGPCRRQELYGLLTDYRIEAAADLFVAAFSTGGPEQVRIEELAMLLLRQVGAEPKATHRTFSLCQEPNGTAARVALEILWLWERAGIAKLYPTEANIIFPLLRGNRALSSPYPAHRALRSPGRPRPAGPGGPDQPLTPPEDTRMTAPG